MAAAFMDKLTERLVDQKQIKPITAKNSVNHLRMLAGGPFASLMFLADKAAVETRLASYSESSRRTLLGSVVGVLRVYKSPVYRGLLKYYNAKFTELRKAAAEGAEPIKTMTEKEKSNWMSWPEILARHAELADDVRPFQKLKDWEPKQHQRYLEYAALSLYVLRPPARNSNYQHMIAVKDDKIATEATEGNYYCVKSRKFIFNDYKTHKKYGQQVADVPVELAKILDTLLRHSKEARVSRGRWKSTPLLATYDGEGLDALNAMTRLLNSALGKRCGCNMLRHSYITHKYGAVANEMAEDAAEMGHSISTQIGEYIRKEPEDVIVHFD